MSSELEIYQRMILDHNKHPRNFGSLDDFDYMAEGVNPLCGDRYRVFVKMVDDQVAALKFEGEGCAISKASASMMTELMCGMHKTEVESMADDFIHFLRKGPNDESVESSANNENYKTIQKMFTNLWKYPARVKCATLIWQTIGTALQGGNNATTELGAPV